MINQIESFDLDETLDCGQCFRWNRQDNGSYTGVVCGRILNISAENQLQILEDPFWQNYFDFQLDYNKIRSDLAESDPTLAEAAKFAPGIHILNQEPWEALCSFIISQNNNIPRIKGIVARLCSQLGKDIGGEHTFPDAKTIAVLDEQDLSGIRCGFRARYLLDAAKKAANGEIDFEDLKRIPLPDARAKLMTITGVGPKVADCTLLYGLHRLDAFPMDVWMKRAMKVLFPGREPESFGNYAGIAQQYIFHYSRKNPHLFQPEE